MNNVFCNLYVNYLRALGVFDWLFLISLSCQGISISYVLCGELYNKKFVYKYIYRKIKTCKQIQCILKCQKLVRIV